MENGPSQRTNDPRTTATVALALAALALVALVAAPHAYLVDDGPDGTTTELRMWWDQLAWDLDHEAVPGGAALYGLASAVVLAVGATLAFFGVRRDHTRIAFAGLATTLVGAVGTLHYSALWTGRTLATVVHTVAGYDAPPAIMRLDAFEPDAWSAVWSIGPALALGLTLAATLLLCRAVAELSNWEFDQRPQARRHLRAAWLGLVVLSVAFAVPLSAQELPDGLSTPDAQDSDTFWFGAYDALRMNQGTTRVADETNEGALRQYDDLSVALWSAYAAVIVLAAASLVGVYGTLRGAEGDRNLGNLLQAPVYAGLLASAALFALVLAVAVWLYRPNADIDATATVLPIAGLVPVFLAILSQVAVARALAAESGTLLADDFPEPIVYD